MPACLASARIIKGIRACLGVDSRWFSWPISNLPPGSVVVRRRLRAGQVAIAFVKTERAGVQRWALVPDEKDNAVKLGWLLGVNTRQ